MKHLKVGLFIPCYIDQFYPHVGVATYELLNKLGVQVEYPLNQTCCGQPLANSGAEKEAKGVYYNFVNNFRQFDYIVSPSGSCVYHVKKHYDILEQTNDVKKVRANIYELCGFIADVLKIEDLKTNFPHKVGLHQSCHGLRGLGLGSPSEIISKSGSKVRNILSKIEGIELVELDRNDECCGFGGTFSIFEPAISAQMGRSRISDHLKNEAEIITATDMSCLMHLEGIIRRESLNIKVMHIAEILNLSRL